MLSKKRQYKFHLKKRYFLLLALFVFSITQISANDPTPPKNQFSTELQKVTLQLKYFHQFQFAGYYAALEKGFYEKAGLDVNIVEGGNLNHIEQVLKGKAEFGIASSEIVISRSEGKPVVVLASIFQTSPSVLLSLKKSKITTVNNLINKKIMLFGDDRDTQLIGIFVKENIINKVSIVPATHNIDNLIKGNVHAISAHSTNELFFLENQNIPYNIMYPRKYGINFYGDCLFTTESQITEHKERTEAFRRASIEGWEYALNNPDEIIDLIIDKYNTKKSREHLTFEAKKTANLIPRKYVVIGNTDIKRWEKIAKTYADIGIINKKYNIKGLLYKYKHAKYLNWPTWLTGAILLIFFLIFYLLIVNNYTDRMVTKETQELLKKNKELEDENMERSRTEKALKESEKRFRMYIENSPNGIIIFDKNARINFTNSSFAELSEYSEEEIKKMTVPEFMIAEQTKYAKHMLIKLLQKGKAQDQMFLKNKRGINIPIHVNAVKISSEQYITFIIDISHIKEVEKELILAKEKAEESDRLKSAFLANMSHEIRTPMNGILGFSQLLKKTDLSPEKSEQYLDIIIRNGEQLLEIINNIISISYLEVNQIKATPTSFSIKTLLEQLKELFQLEKIKMKKTNINIKFNNKINDSVSNIYSDEGKLKQILTNLLSNSLKFTDKGYVELTVQLKNSKLFFEVKDSGIGIPEEKQNIIFRRFGQVEDIHTRDFGGIGLGLAISKGLVELLGGEMYLKSELNKGSTFTFYVPYKSSTTEQYKPQESIKQNNYDWSDKTILVVEDVEENALFIEEVLKKTKIHVIFAHNGKEAVDIYKNKKNIDVILMDIQMPYMNGIEATKEIRKFDAEIPIIAQTAFATKEDEIETIKAGCNDYTAKPINPENLIKKISMYF